MFQKLMTCILLIAAFHTKAQFKSNVTSYYKEINAAKICYVKKDYAGAVKCYEKAKKYQLPQKDDIRTASYWYEMAKDEKKAVSAFYEAVLTGIDNNYERDYPDCIVNKKGTKEYSQFISKGDSLNKIFQKKSNIPFSLLIKALYTKDQYIRQDIFLENADSIVKKFAWNYLYTSDTLGMNELLSYIDEHGVSDARTLSDEILINFKMVVHHNIASPHSSEKKEKLRKVITQAIYEGKLPNIFLYNALDYEQVLLGKKELYGTYSSRTSDRNVTYSNISDITHLDERRAEWLLIPLYWSMRYNFEDNYQLPEGYNFKDQ